MNATTKITKGETLSEALVGAFADMGAAAKDKTNPAFKSKYADIASVIETIKPVLVKHGLAFEQHMHPSPDGVTVETIVRHLSGETASFGTLYVPANKKDAQGFGSALTYARRYALLTAFGVPTEDDDGNAASRSSARAEPAGTIDDSQVAQLQGYANAGVIDAMRFCKFFQIDAFPELPASRWNEAVAMAEAKAKRAKEPELVK